MNEETKTPEELEAIKAEAEKKELEAKQQQDEAEKKLSAEELYTKWKETSAEAKQRRLELKEIKEKLVEFEKKEALEKEKDLKAKGKYEEIITDLKKKLDEYEPLAIEHKTYIETKKAELKKDLMENDLWLDSFDKLTISELESIQAKIKKGKVPTDSSNVNYQQKNGKDLREAWEKLM